MGSNRGVGATDGIAVIDDVWDSYIFAGIWVRRGQCDPAIWLAAVSFGCVHESYLSPSLDQHVNSTFAMRQFNADAEISHTILSFKSGVGIE